MTQSEHDEAVARIHVIDDRLVAVERIAASGPLTGKEKRERSALKSERRKILAEYKATRKGDSK